MPTMPPTLHRRSTRERGRAYDAERRRAKPWRAWYNTAIWRRIRDDQLRRQPLCERCLAKGLTVAATVCNHKTPHRGDWEAFIAGPFESACAPCHNSDIQREERQPSG
jgi:hypothetical protein